MDKKAIEIKNLSYSIEEKKILEGIRINIEKNHFVGLIGPNGSGKSTLLKNIYRYYKPLKEIIYLEGKDVLDYKTKDLAKRMSVLSQERTTRFDFPVMEILLMARFPHKKFLEGNTKEDYQICLESLGQVGLEGFEDRSFHSLSGGEKQRVLLAATLVQKSSLLILDEPSNHLDIKYQIMALNVIKTLKDTTVFTSLHDLNLVAKYCDWVIALNQGKVMAEGRPEDVLREEILEELFGVKTQVKKEEGELFIRYLYI